MQAVMAIGMGSLVLASGVIGTRLLILAQRSQRLPELLMGISLVLQGVFGYAAGLASNAESPVLGMGAVELRCLAATSFNLGAVALAVFNWSVFRPERWALGLAAALSALLVASSIGHWVVRADVLIETPWWGIGIGARLLCFGWGAFEAGRQYVLGCRRLRIGLADALVVNRFLLWSMGETTLVITLGAQSLVMATRGIEALFAPAIVLPLTAAAIFAATTVWLAFLPPRAYVRRFVGAEPEPAVS